jgi:hypothetical protein
LWIAGILMVGVFVACGYLEGVNESIYSSK